MGPTTKTKAAKRKDKANEKAKEGKEPKQQNLSTVGKGEKKLQRVILYYSEKRDYRMGATEDEVAAKTALLAVMEETGHKEGDVYTFTDGGTKHSCTLIAGELKPKVKSVEV